jgi:putative addiction module killer protein
MLHSPVFEIVHYQQPDGSSPFQEWMERLRDKQAKVRIATRLRHLGMGNMGDAKPVGEGVLELRIHAGAGYRVYCARYGEHWIVLLCGGDKSSQSKDIERAKIFWGQWKRRQP